MKSQLLINCSFALIYSLLTIDTFAEETKNKDPLEELKVKREEVFEFVQKPTLKQQGDHIEISFETKGFCDVTIAIENKEGKILRHLVSGVLGANAPAPLQKNSKKQMIVWDGKNDLGNYIDNKSSHTIRVSLGLKPQFEKNVLWSPYRRINPSRAPILTACDEGILVFSGNGLDHLQLLDHDGNYLRTIYPFPHKKLDQIKGLTWHTFPQDGQKLPLKLGHVQSTLLTAGSSSDISNIFGTGFAATGMAVYGKRIALAGVKNMNWLSLDGSTSGKELTGPSTKLTVSLGTIHEFRSGNYDQGPRSMAFSPDGKWIYLTSFIWSYTWHQGAIHGVFRMPADGSTPYSLWKGSEKQQKVIDNGKKREGGVGEAPADFILPMSVACDAKGRVYIADYFNDRIQVFNEDGSFVKTIPTNKPTKVVIDPKSGDIYAFSWIVSNYHDWSIALAQDKKHENVPATLTHFGPVENPTVKKVYDLPLLGDRGEPHNNKKGGAWHAPREWYAAEIDFKAKEPTVWLIPSYPWNGKYELSAIKLFTLQEGKLILKRDTGKELTEKIPVTKPAPFSRQRLITNPATGNLYVLELVDGTDKAIEYMTEFNPTTGKSKLIQLPCTAEDACIDMNNMIYLRVDLGIIRYDLDTWQEIPWDYGEEIQRVTFQRTSSGKATSSPSLLRVPGARSNPFWHLGGMSISPKGYLAVTTYNAPKIRKSTSEAKQRTDFAINNTYKPTIYPGRYVWGEIHVYNKHGSIVTNDAFPGMGHADGIFIGKDDSIYTMLGSTRMYNGKKYDPTARDYTETIVKVPLNKAKLLTSGRAAVPLQKSEYPDRPIEISGDLGAGGDAWIENAEWFYGGVGSNFMNQAAPSCCCWNSRFTLDYLDRTFAPELRHSSVAVLDSAGNLILRVGRYGNIDEGKPLVQDPDMKNPPESIGGDEVSLFYAPFVATHTDKRLYIADPGNNRIVCVKLNYHTEEKLSIADK